MSTIAQVLNRVVAKYLEGSLVDHQRRSDFLMRLMWTEPEKYHAEDLRAQTGRKRAHARHYHARLRGIDYAEQKGYATPEVAAASRRSLEAAWRIAKRKWPLKRRQR